MLPLLRDHLLNERWLFSLILLAILGDNGYPEDTLGILPVRLV